jgi:hypothetical protein
LDAAVVIGFDTQSVAIERNSLHEDSRILQPAGKKRRSGGRLGIPAKPISIKMQQLLCGSIPRRRLAIKVFHPNEADICTDPYGALCWSVAALSARSEKDPSQPVYRPYGIEPPKGEEIGHRDL